MRRRKGSRITVIFVLAACIAAGAPRVLAAAPLKIGVILALTGNFGAVGQSMRDGITLAVDEINSHGGVNGSRIDIRIEDSGSDTQAGVEAFSRLESTMAPLFYISMGSGLGVALAPFADAKKVVLVGLTTSAFAFTQGREMVFRYYPLAQAEIAPLLRILNDLKVKKLGIVYSTDEYGAEVQRLLKRDFEKSGGTVTTRSFALDETDMSRQIEELKDLEAIVVSNASSSLPNVVRRIRAVQYAGSVMIPSGGSAPSNFSLPEMQGVYMAAPIIYNQHYLYAREAAGKFLARFKTPFTLYAANGYDFIKLVAGLLEDEPLSRQAVKDVLSAGFSYSGVFGPLNVKPGERDIAFPLYPVQVINSTLVYR
jgi:branched-chain amino acid transport system substrate-binding protein